MRDFDRFMNDHQTAWREKHIASKDPGWQNGKPYPWILPRPGRSRGIPKETLWEGISSSLAEYIAGSGVQAHTGTHNLKSSWVLCANLFFPFRNSDHEMLSGFLRENVSDLICEVEGVELEYETDPAPSELLGEPKGVRGQNQTSPDVAFVFRTKDGKKGVVLTENKFTEHSFYRCSGRSEKYGNPDQDRCRQFDENLQHDCYQRKWQDGDRENRRYWDYLTISEAGREALRCCPAATAGYQLFRQQALAEAVIKSGSFDYAISCVAYDERNQALLKCLRRTGVDDFRTGWGSLFDGQAQFATFSHQQWVEWVRGNDSEGRWGDWLEYVCERYGYER